MITNLILKSTVWHCHQNKLLSVTTITYIHVQMYIDLVSNYWHISIEEKETCSD
jgi:hypothetical protein